MNRHNFIYGIFSLEIIFFLSKLKFIKNKNTFIWDSKGDIWLGKNDDEIITIKSKEMPSYKDFDDKKDTYGMAVKKKNKRVA